MPNGENCLRNRFKSVDGRDKPGHDDSEDTSAHLISYYASRLRRLVQRLEFADKRVGPLRDIARAQTNHIVAGLRQLFYQARDLLRTIERNHLAMAARAQALHQRIAIGA